MNPVEKAILEAMDIYLDKYLSNEIADMPERKEYEEAMKEGMYIFPQEVK